MLKRFPHKLYGLVGNPVEHSLSPYMHNAAFAKNKIDAAYLPFLVQKTKLKQAIAALRSIPIAGFNVTVPFKSECMQYLDKVDPIAKAIGAVNTVVNKKGKLIGCNTDYAGFLKSLKQDLGFDPKAKTIFLIGAGGAARAIGFGLAQAKACRIVVYDILFSKARSLSEDIKSNFPDTQIIPCRSKDMGVLIKDCDLLVNCTPIGMASKDPLPIKAGFLHKKLKVYDIIYNPVRTRLVEYALKKSIDSTNGINMLLYQGSLAFEWWTKQKAPIGLMRKELLGHLKC
jgi:shikimate dehydrogenase